MMTYKPIPPLTTSKAWDSCRPLGATGVGYRLSPLLKAALDRNDFPLVFNAEATRAACEHDILLDEHLMAQPEAMTSQSAFLELSSHRRLCEEVLAAANHAITKNHRIELSAQMMAKSVALLILQDS